MTLHGRTGIRRGGGILAILAALAVFPSAASAGTFEYVPDVDTYVDSAAPTAAYGNSSGVSVDASPVREAYLRFRVTGLGGRAVQGAKLRLHSREASVFGGRVYRLSPTSWSEATTYETKPAIDGPLLGTLGAVANGRSYEIDLSQTVTREGTYAFAIDSTSSDSARYGSRESTLAPKLLLETSDIGATIDGLSQVTDGASGSSSPTYYGSNHHLAKTSAGRLLAVHGRHATGVAVKWRDPEGGWRSSTLGSNSGGLILTNGGTGDWPASIAIARDADGEEHAWVVWSRISYSYAKPVQMARLSNLDSPQGPTIGLITTVDAPAGGAYRADIGIEREADGRDRGVVLWSRKAGENLYEVVTGWFDDLTSSQPTITNTKVHVTSTSSYQRYGTLEPTAAGMRAAIRDDRNYVQVFTHAAGSAPTSWVTAPATNVMSGNPSAAALDSGELLVAFESSSSKAEVRVQRFSQSAQPASAELKITGYTQPTIASDGTRAWIVMVRVADGYLVSREFTPATGWSAADRVEVGAEGGGNHAHPNTLRRTDGRLRFVFRGPRGSTNSATSVLAVQRGL